MEKMEASTTTTFLLGAPRLILTSNLVWVEKGDQHQSIVKANSAKVTTNPNISGDSCTVNKKQPGIHRQSSESTSSSVFNFRFIEYLVVAFIFAPFNF